MNTILMHRRRPRAVKCLTVLLTFRVHLKDWKGKLGYIALLWVEEPPADSDTV